MNSIRRSLVMGSTEGLQHAAKDMWDLLKCPLCQDFFKAPVLLPSCSHNFCSCCLPSLAAVRECPVCRQRVSDEDTPVRNGILENMVQIFKESIQGPTDTADLVNDSVESGTGTLSPQDDECVDTEEEVGNGSVSCPVCKASIHNRDMNSHLDECLVVNANESLENVQEPLKPPLPNYVYQIMSHEQLKKKVEELGLPGEGSKEDLLRRLRNHAKEYKSRRISNRISPCQKSKSADSRSHSVEGETMGENNDNLTRRCRRRKSGTQSADEDENADAVETSTRQKDQPRKSRASSHNDDDTVVAIETLRRRDRPRKSPARYTRESETVVAEETSMRQKDQTRRSGMWSADEDTTVRAEATPVRRRSQSRNFPPQSTHEDGNVTPEEVAMKRRDRFRRFLPWSAGEDDIVIVKGRTNRKKGWPRKSLPQSTHEGETVVADETSMMQKERPRKSEAWSADEDDTIVAEEKTSRRNRPRKYSPQSTDGNDGATAEDMSMKQKDQSRKSGAWSTDEDETAVSEKTTKRRSNRARKSLAQSADEGETVTAEEKTRRRRDRPRKYPPQSAGEDDGATAEDISMKQKDQPRKSGAWSTGEDETVVSEERTIRRSNWTRKFLAQSTDEGETGTAEDTPMRRRGRLRNSLGQSTDEDDNVIAEEVTLKRTDKFGRFLGWSAGEDDTVIAEEKTRRKRGRPRKSLAQSTQEVETVIAEQIPMRQKEKPRKSGAWSTDEDETVPEVITKRGRGRPRKSLPQSTDEGETVVAENIPMRQKDQARKSRGWSTDEDESVSELITKRGRRRPRKSLPQSTDEDETVSEVITKRGRGRPRKSLPQSTDEDDNDTPEKVTMQKTDKFGRFLPLSADEDDTVIAEEKTLLKKKDQSRKSGAGSTDKDETALEGTTKRGRGWPRKSLLEVVSPGILTTDACSGSPEGGDHEPESCTVEKSCKVERRRGRLRKGSSGNDGSPCIYLNSVVDGGSSQDGSDEDGTDVADGTVQRRRGRPRKSEPVIDVNRSKSDVTDDTAQFTVSSVVSHDPSPSPVSRVSTPSESQRSPRRSRRSCSALNSDGDVEHAVEKPRSSLISSDSSHEKKLKGVDGNSSNRKDSKYCTYIPVQLGSRENMDMSVRSSVEEDTGQSTQSWRSPSTNTAGSPSKLDALYNLKKLEIRLYRSPVSESGKGRRSIYWPYVVMDKGYENGENSARESDEENSQTSICHSKSRKSVDSEVANESQCPNEGLDTGVKSNKLNPKNTGCGRTSEDFKNTKRTSKYWSYVPIIPGVQDSNRSEDESDVEQDVRSSARQRLRRSLKSCEVISSGSSQINTSPTVENVNSSMPRTFENVENSSDLQSEIRRKCSRSSAPVDDVGLRKRGTGEENGTSKKKGSRFWTYELVPSNAQPVEKSSVLGSEICRKRSRSSDPGAVKSEGDVSFRKREKVIKNGTSEKSGSKFWTYELVPSDVQPVEYSSDLVSEVRIKRSRSSTPVAVRPEDDVDFRKREKVIKNGTGEKRGSKFWTYELVPSDVQPVEYSSDLVSEVHIKRSRSSTPVAVRPEDDGRLGRGGKGEENRTSKKKASRFWSYEIVPSDVQPVENSDPGSEVRRKSSRSSAPVAVRPEDDVGFRKREKVIKNGTSEKRGSKFWTYELVPSDVQPVENSDLVSEVRIKRSRSSTPVNVRPEGDVRLGSRGKGEENRTSKKKASKFWSYELVPSDVQPVENSSDVGSEVHRKSSMSSAPVNVRPEGDVRLGSRGKGEENRTTKKKASRFWSYEIVPSDVQPVEEFPPTELGRGRRVKRRSLIALGSDATGSGTEELSNSDLRSPTPKKTRGTPRKGTTPVAQDEGKLSSSKHVARNDDNVKEIKSGNSKSSADETIPEAHHVEETSSGESNSLADEPELEDRHIVENTSGESNYSADEHAPEARHIEEDKSGESDSSADKPAPEAHHIEENESGQSTVLADVSAPDDHHIVENQSSELNSSACESTPEVRHIEEDNNELNSSADKPTPEAHHIEENKYGESTILADKPEPEAPHIEVNKSGESNSLADEPAPEVHHGEENRSCESTLLADKPAPEAHHAEENKTDETNFSADEPAPEACHSEENSSHESNHSDCEPVSEACHIEENKSGDSNSSADQHEPEDCQIEEDNNDLNSLVDEPAPEAPHIEENKSGESNSSADEHEPEDCQIEEDNNELNSSADKPTPEVHHIEENKYGESTILADKPAPEAPHIEVNKSGESNCSADEPAPEVYRTERNNNELTSSAEKPATEAHHDEVVSFATVQVTEKERPRPKSRTDSPVTIAKVIASAEKKRRMESQDRPKLVTVPVTPTQEREDSESESPNLPPSVNVLLRRQKSSYSRRSRATTKSDLRKSAGPHSVQRSNELQGSLEKEIGTAGHSSQLIVENESMPSDVPNLSSTNSSVVALFLQEKGDSVSPGVSEEVTSSVSKVASNSSKNATIGLRGCGIGIRNNTLLGGHTGSYVNTVPLEIKSPAKTSSDSLRVWGTLRRNRKRPVTPPMPSPLHVLLDRGKRQKTRHTDSGSSLKGPLFSPGVSPLKSGGGSGVHVMSPFSSPEKPGLNSLSLPESPGLNCFSSPEMLGLPSELFDSESLTPLVAGIHCNSPMFGGAELLEDEDHVDGLGFVDDSSSERDRDEDVFGSISQRIDNFDIDAETLSDLNHNVSPLQVEKLWPALSRRPEPSPSSLFECVETETSPKAQDILQIVPESPIIHSLGGRPCRQRASHDQNSMHQQVKTAKKRL